MPMMRQTVFTRGAVGRTATRPRNRRFGGFENIPGVSNDGIAEPGMEAGNVAKDKGGFLAQDKVRARVTSDTRSVATGMRTLHGTRPMSSLSGPDRAGALQETDAPIG